MIEVSGTFDGGVAFKALDKLERNLERATAIALTATAKAAEDILKDRMRSVFDRPTPFTMSATVVRRARYSSSSRSGSLQSSVVFKDWQARYLDTMVEGFSPDRGLKRFELALQAAGVMPRGWVCVPANGVALDGYGNVGRGQIMKIMSQIGTELLTGYQNRSTDPKRRAANKRRNGTFFAMQPGNRQGLPAGIYQRYKTGFGWASRMVFVFARRASYTKYFDLQKIGEQAMSECFDTELQKALAS